MHDAVIRGQHAQRRRRLEDVDQGAVFFQPVRDAAEVFCREGAEHEDEQVVQDDVVQTEVESVLDEGIVGMDRPDITGIEVEGHVGEEEKSKRQPRCFIHEAQERPPQGHEEVEPQEDDQEVNMIHGQAVPQGAEKGVRLEDTEVVADDRYVDHVKQGPGQVGDEDRPQAAPQVVFIDEGLVQGLAVEHAESRQEEKGRHGKTGQDFQDGHQAQVGRRIDDGDGADMDGDDAEHTKAAHIVDRMNESF